MQFELDPEQLALQESVQRFFDETYGFEQRRALLATPFGSSPEVWNTFAEQGLLSIGLPEAHGGIGGAPEAMLVMEEIGRALVLEPWASTMALCAPLLSHGTAAQQGELFPRIAAGRCKLALAHGEPDARYALDDVRTVAKRRGNSYVLNGTKTTVLDGAVADLFLVSARDEAQTGVFLVEPTTSGLQVARYRTQDGRSAADLTLRDVTVDAAQLLGDGRDAQDAIERAVEHAIAALCAEAVGAMEAANAATVEYTKSRKQFGQPIGRFQALQHRMADMFVYATQARSMSILATGRCGETDPALRRRDIASAKCYVGKAARFVGQQAVQLHGGMGMADELAVSHYFKRLTLINATFGDAAHHLAAVSDAILREAAPAEEPT